MAGATGVPRWPAAHNQRKAAAVENSTSATPAAICGAMRIKRGKDRGESAQAFLSRICPSPDMQSALGDSAKCAISIEDGRTGLRADYSAHPRNLARNAWGFDSALRRAVGGDSRGHGRTKPPHLKATLKPTDSRWGSGLEHPTSSIPHPKPNTALRRKSRRKAIWISLPD